MDNEFSMECMRCLPWHIGNLTIPYLLGHDCSQEIHEHLIELKPDIVLIITDERVAELYACRLKRILEEKLQVELIILKEGEAQKTLKSLEVLAVKALELGLTRKSIILALGGGVIGNISGLLAALLFRGIRLVHMPTTLLAMHDSVTSLKQAVNCNGIKNILGTYYSPTAIFVDITVLNTLPIRHLKSGMVELLKNALIFGGKYLEKLQHLLPFWRSKDPSIMEQLVELGVEAKYQVLQSDPKEQMAGIAFEYGHTIGHALELISNGTLRHGEAVAWGMKCAAAISHRLGYLASESLIEHNNLLYSLGKFNLPDPIPPIEEVMNRIVCDNKKGIIEKVKDYVPMILLEDVGKVFYRNGASCLENVPNSVIKESLKNLWT